MSRHIRRIGPNSWVACAVVMWLIAIGSVRAGTLTPRTFVAPPENSPSAQNPPQAPKTPPQAPKTPPQAAAPTAAYVGEATCLTCHDDKKQGYVGSPHARAADPRSPAAKQGCESCHGPGGNHVTDPVANPVKRFSKLPAAEVNATCTTCHNRGSHGAWEGSAHDRRNLSCTTCHSVHSPKSAEKQLVQPTETQVCATCHRLQVTKTERAVAHMPVREGKMSCSSCHNPHGSITNVKNLKTGSSVAELCTSCHTEMRGPMLFEHAPVRENCATCHDPHGSSNDRMLVVRMPMLCQRCHIASKHPATLYDKDQITTNKSNRMFGRSCVNCHSNIHGSNHPSGQFFMR
jgi:DmsE family decaheme c-type cytochrome